MNVRKHFHVLSFPNEGLAVITLCLTVPVKVVMSEGSFRRSRVLSIIFTANRTLRNIKLEDVI